MSIEWHYFFDADLPLHELASKVNDCLGCNLTPYEGDATDYFCRFLSLEFSLGHNPFHYDPEHELGSHLYELSTRVPSPDGELLAIQPEVMVIVPYVLFARMNVDAGVLVDDSMFVTARYETRINPDGRRGWYDAVADTEVVRVADYMIGSLPKRTRTTMCGR